MSAVAAFFAQPYGVLMFLFQRLVAVNSADTNSFARVNRATSKTSLRCKTGGFDAGFDCIDERNKRYFVRYRSRRDTLMTVVYWKQRQLICREYATLRRGARGRIVIQLYPFFRGRCCLIRCHCKTGYTCNVEIEHRTSRKVYLRACSRSRDISRDIPYPDCVKEMLQTLRVWRKHKFGEIGSVRVDLGRTHRWYNWIESRWLLQGVGFLQSQKMLLMHSKLCWVALSMIKLFDRVTTWPAVTIWLRSTRNS